MAKLLTLIAKVALALALLPATAMAWDTPPPPAQSPAPWAKSHSTATANPSTTVNAPATATGGRARASQSQKLVVVAPQNGGASASLQGPGNVNAPVTTWNGWNGNPVASAVAPPVTTYNPCAGAAGSFGAQTPMFGLSAGGNEMDRGCQIMNSRVPWASEWAAATLCRESRDVRRAAQDIGHPCPQDTPPAPVATPVAAPVPEPVGANGYCAEHMTKAEWLRHPECK